MKILIVEDNLILSGMLEKWLQREGYEVLASIDELSARHILKKHDIDLVLSDVRLAEGNGISLLEWMTGAGMEIPFVVMTEYASVADAVRAVKLGAKDYLSKPVYREQLLELLHTLLKRPIIVRKELAIIERDSPAAKEVVSLACRVAPSDLRVMVLGPSGSGKESVARMIHQYSDRCEGPFVALNCGSIPDSLMASEFFGSVKGAFTGSVQNQKGYFDMANGGTLFLDEIGNMSHDMQAFLLRVIQEKEFSPIGSRKLRHIDVRIISATNEDMGKAVKEGRFREDLYYRLAELEICQPPLIECKEDILLLAEFFRKDYSQRMRIVTDGFTEEAKRALLSYPWPGNIRELNAKVKRAVLLADKPWLDFSDLGLDATAFSMGPEERNEVQVVQEKERISSLLEQNHGNVKKTASQLGVSRVTLYNKMKKHGLK